MTRNNWHKRSEDSPSSSESGKSGKTVRFMNNHHHSNYGDKRHNSANIHNVPQQHHIHPVHGMVQQLVPHLPGLDKDKVYVISGPFPNFDPVSGPSQCLMATPVSAGATIIAVPSGPPPPVHGVQGAPHGQPQHVTKPPEQQTPAPVTTNGNPGGQQVYHPPNPQMLHWDNHHPTGHILPLRQPNPPVYYNVPAAGGTPGGSDTSSGLQSPCSGSDACCMSDCSSDTSPDTPDTAAPPAVPMANRIVFQPSPAPYPHMTTFMDIHSQKHFQDPPHYCHLRGQEQFGHMFIPSHCPPHPPHGLDHMMGQQQRINQQVTCPITRHYWRLVRGNHLSAML